MTLHGQISARLTGRPVELSEIGSLVILIHEVHFLKYERNWNHVCQNSIESRGEFRRSLKHLIHKRNLLEEECEVVHAKSCKHACNSWIG